MLIITLHLVKEEKMAKEKKIEKAEEVKVEKQVEEKKNPNVVVDHALIK